MELILETKEVWESAVAFWAVYFALSAKRIAETLQLNSTNCSATEFL
jgi:hypothetical protein